MFHCTPDEALRQDPVLVQAIIEARMAQQAKDIHNAPGHDVNNMPDGMANLWVEMIRALED